MFVTLVTGASSGIGRSLARRLAKQGDFIVALARRMDLLQSLVAEIQAAGGRALALQCDVTDRDQVLRACAEAVRSAGPIDRLVANAGGGERMKVNDFNAGGVAQMLAVNVTGTANCIEAVLPSMLARGHGHVVIMGSLAAWRGIPGAAGYSAAKAALGTLAEGLRVDLRPRGIDVTLLLPGFVATRERKRRRPFEVPLEAATERMTTAILARRRVYAFPFPLVVTATLLRWMPDWLYDRTAQRFLGQR
ncbi:MAG: short-chain dehydrogenase [Gammaproteobacteria bacterium RIFCSPLOWO2_02_FULL_61_13]|nr:MAG: short-chain dehydrogenase [Gammaproteobacteria bacterium RIFCSPLOWO2_02_FULL_61_13]